MNISMTKTTHPGKLPPAARLGFGFVFTDHMFLMNYTDREGWHNARIVPFGPISISPAASVLHYGTEVFEGLKAYRRPDGAVQLFRPWENVARLNRSCDRLGLPRIDERDGLQALRELVKMDAAWVPSAPGTSLYIRPFLYSTDPTLALHGVHEATFAIILSPSGSYFSDGLKPVPIMVETEDVRAVRGGNHGLNRVRHVMRTAVIVLILAVSGGLAISSLMSGATLMELNAQVDEVSAQLAEAQSEYDYLNTRMNDITSRASLQQVAEGELGLVKADPSQITYVQLEDQSIIERNTGAAGRLLDEVRTAALSLLDSLNP